MMGFFRLFGGVPWTFIVIGLLTASTATAGYLLKKSYESNGQQREIVNQLEQANKITAEALRFERDQFKHLQEKMAALKNEYEVIDFELSNARKALNEIPDKTGCLDIDLGDDFWMLIYPENSADPTVRTD